MNNKQGEYLLNSFISKCVRQYTNFMGIDKMPSFDIVPISISLDEAKNKGYGSFASHYYDINTGAHRLEVWKDFHNFQVDADYLLFHEFTHIVDTEIYSDRDKKKNVAIKGYTEYHAAQIDFLRILGSKSVKDITSFSLEQEVETLSRRESALEYVLEAHNTAAILLARPGFPADIETLATTIGLLFNYLGRLSICKMYAVDYRTYIDKFSDTTLEQLFFGKDVYQVIDVFLRGWLSEPHIKILGGVYLKIIDTKGQVLLKKRVE